MYSYICVLDFEATCDDQTKLNPRNEIIEFPSVLLKLDHDTGKYIKVSEFQRFCKPLYNTQLTNFCKQLTGITQAQVDTGINFTQALQEHHEWLIQHTGLVYDGNDPVVIVTCGNWDLCTMMPDECRRWDVIPNHIYRSVINIKTAYTSVYGIKGGDMAAMLNTSKIQLEGRHHSGLDDSKNIAKLAQHFTDKGFRWTKDIRTIIPYEAYVNKRKNQRAIANKEKVKQRTT